MSRAYRVVVESWPTPDGLPWKRFYGLDGAEVPEWVDAKVQAIRAVSWREREWKLRDRIKDHDDYDTYSVTMPVPRRKVMLSASGAHGIARHMTAFGAVVRIERSEPIQWPTDTCPDCAGPYVEDMCEACVGAMGVGE